MFKKLAILIVLAAIMIATSGCGLLPGQKAPTATPDPTKVELGLQVLNLQNTVTAQAATVEATSTHTPTSTRTPSGSAQMATATPEVAAATATLVPTDGVPVTGTKFDYDLFDRGNGLCFVVERQQVGKSYRVLEFLYGLLIKGDTLEEYAPAERGSDKNTWPSQVILLDAKTNRATKCGEVEARHPILYRMTPESDDLVVQWILSMDWSNPNYAAAYQAASVKSNHLGLFFGSEKGADLLVEVFDESGKLISTETARVAGAFCSNCRVGTSLNGTQAQFGTDPEDFAFDDSTRKVLTTDLYSLVLPKDFKGTYRLTVKGPGEWWLGELRPLQVTPSVTPTITATP